MPASLHLSARVPKLLKHRKDSPMRHGPLRVSLAIEIKSSTESVVPARDVGSRMTVSVARTRVRWQPRARLAEQRRAGTKVSAKKTVIQCRSLATVRRNVLPLRSRH